MCVECKHCTHIMYEPIAAVWLITETLTVLPGSATAKPMSRSLLNSSQLTHHLVS